MHDYKFLKIRGALSEAGKGAPLERPAADPLELLGTAPIPRDLIALVPESVARENTVVPLSFDGETITFAAADADNIALADKLRFMLAKNVRLLPAHRDSILAVIQHYYGTKRLEAVDSLLHEFADTADLSPNLHEVAAAGRT